MTEGKREEEFKTRLPKLIIDLVWEATDGGTKLTEHSFQHFDEPLASMTYLLSAHLASVADAVKEERERCVDIVRRLITSDAICGILSVAIREGRGKS